MILWTEYDIVITYTFVGLGIFCDNIENHVSKQPVYLNVRLYNINSSVDIEICTDTIIIYDLVFIRWRPQFRKNEYILIKYLFILFIAILYLQISYIKINWFKVKLFKTHVPELFVSDKFSLGKPNKVK